MVGGNAYGHPSAEMLARYSGVSLYRTDEDGSVVLMSDRVRSER
jgi:beta-lactamase superfamily II metal-dependent hydrolase